MGRFDSTICPSEMRAAECTDMIRALEEAAADDAKPKATTTPGNNIVLSPGPSATPDEVVIDVKPPKAPDAEAQAPKSLLIREPRVQLLDEEAPRKPKVKVESESKPEPVEESSSTLPVEACLPETTGQCPN